MKKIETNTLLGMRIIKFILLLTIFISVSCKDEQPKKVNAKTSAKKVQHYICENNCENSGAAVAGNCPVCKNPYLHNTAFHADDLLKGGPINVQSNATQPGAPITTTNTNRAPEPAQNANGVYHYTCSNGCAGGAGTTTNCKACGEALAHNTAYHN